MKQYHFMKNLLIGKIILVVASICLYQGWIQFGDKKIIAAGDDKTEDADEVKEDKVVQPQDVEKLNQTENDEKNLPKKKSFLNDLFTLPKLSAKKIQKEELGKFLELAERKERQIDERSRQLAKREEQLKKVEKSIDEKLVKIDEERKFLAKTIQQEKDLKGERLDRLVELYDKMEPKKAAPAFEKLDKDLIVALFKKLKQKQVTTILETMNPEKSVELTEYFARVKSAKEYDLLKELNESLKKEFQECKGLPVMTAATENQAPGEKSIPENTKK